MFFDDTVTDNDMIYKVGTVKIILDQQTAEWLVGSKLEMVDGDFQFEHLPDNDFIDEEIVYN